MVDTGDVSDVEEARYLEAARRGDLAAFNWLVLRYQVRVYNLCYRMLSDADAAADATQDAFLSAYRAMARFRGEQFKTWLLRIATNACLDMLRRQKRRPSQSLERWHDAPGEEPEPLQVPDLDANVDPEARALRAEVAAAIQIGLDGLPEDQRLALVLVDVQGLTYDEAAAISGANLGTIKSRISRARGKMRDYLLERGILPASQELSAQGMRLMDES